MEILSTRCPRPAVGGAYVTEHGGRGRGNDIGGRWDSDDGGVHRGPAGTVASDLQQLNDSACMRATGLEPLEGGDFVNEAIARLLSGSRRWPRKVPLVVFLLQTMRSIANSHWKRLERPKEVRESALLAVAEAGDGIVDWAPDVSMEPEARTLAAETLARIEDLFSGDEDAMTVISGAGNGKSPAEIQTEACMDATRYATIRRRIRRRVIQTFSEEGGVT